MKIEMAEENSPTLKVYVRKKYITLSNNMQIGSHID